MPGARQGSFLHVRRGETREICPPLLHIEGQLEAPFPDELPLLDWLAQGTLWWLRNLGSLLVDRALRWDLFHSLLELDRTRYPELLDAVAYHPIVPLCDGSWISLQKLREYPVAYQAVVSPGESLPGWLDQCPVVYSGGSFARLNEFLSQPLLDATELCEGARAFRQWREQPVHPGTEGWSYPLKTPLGTVRLGRRLGHCDGNCVWILSGQVYQSRPLFDDLPLSLQISLDVTPPTVSPTVLKAVQTAVVGDAAGLLGSLPRTREYFHPLCCLAVLLIRQNREVPKWVWQFPVRRKMTLETVRLGRADLRGFPATHPVWLLEPRWCRPPNTGEQPQET